MPNLIQIKRSLGTGAAAQPGSLQPGELAFTSNGGILFVGNTSAVVPIGGVRSPGTLTANQALVANSTSGIDKIITANLTLSSFSVNTINATANLTTLGAAGNNELTTTWAIKTFVDAKIAQASNPQGSNGQFQYNDSGVLAGTNNMVFNNSTGQITIGNSSTNVQLGFTGSINSLAHFHGNQNSYVQVIMNNVNNGNRSSSDFVAENDIGDETSNFVDLGINSSTYNDTAFSAMGAGDSYLYAANNNLTIGTASAGDIKFITGGTTSSQIRVEIDAGGNVGIGNTTPNARLQVTGTANVSGNVALAGITTFSGNVVLGTVGISANGSFGANDFYLSSNGSSTFWRQVAVNAGTNGGLISNSSGIFVDAGSGLLTNSTGLHVGTGNGVTVSADAIQVTQGSGLAVNSTGVHVLANSGITANSTGTFVTQGNGLTVNSTGVHVLANTGIIANTTGTFVNATYIGTISANNASFLGGTAAANFVQNTDSRTLSGNLIFSAANVAFTGNARIAGGLIANNSTGVAGEVLHSNGTSVYWAADDQGVTSVATGNGMIGGTITTTGTVSVLANNGIVANSTGVFARAANGISVDGSGINVTGGDGLVSNATGVHVGAANGISVSADAVAVTGGSTLTVNTTGVHVNSTLSIQDLTLAGNLVVQGTLTTLDTTNLAVEDPLIAFAINQANTATYIDADDIGFFGSYGNTSQKIYTGLFRDQSDSGIYKLFFGQIPDPTTTINTSNVNFTISTLQAFLRSGGLTTNSTSANLIANSTYSVGIVANTITLATALAATSGGTGQSTYTSGDILVANTGNTLSKLGLGSDGFVLQSNGTAVVYATLDGGTF